MAVVGNVISRVGKGELADRAARAIPWIGIAVAIVGVFGAVRRKGLLRGSVDTALNALPIIGTVKNLAEGVRGRDFLADRPVTPRR
jgi:hypothetical protein